MTILAFGGVRTNAQRILDCRDLGYLQDHVIDLTYGKGSFWTLYRPDNLTANDLDPTTDAHHWDFTDVPVPDATYRTVVLDPPYKLNGTSTGGGPSALDASYGVGGEYRTPAQKHALIFTGIREGVRMLAPRGHLLIKCQDQVANGHKYWQGRMFAEYAEERGCTQVDMLYVEGYRVQPSDRTQRHAHQDFSTLLVMRKGR